LPSELNLRRLSHMTYFLPLLQLDWSQDLQVEENREEESHWINLLPYSLSQRTCTELRHPSFYESICVL